MYQTKYTSAALPAVYNHRIRTRCAYIKGYPFMMASIAIHEPNLPLTLFFFWFFFYSLLLLQWMWNIILQTYLCIYEFLFIALFGCLALRYTHTVNSWWCCVVSTHFKYCVVMYYKVHIQQFEWWIMYVYLCLVYR